MNFGKAIAALKEGKKVTRDCWFDKFIWLKPEVIIKTEWCKDPILIELCKKNGGGIEALPTISVYSDGTVLTGWQASSDDILGEDWLILE